MCKYSGGSLYHFPNYHSIREQREVRRFEQLLTHYLTRDLAVDVVMRLRLSRGLSVHSLHGNLFTVFPDTAGMGNATPDTTIAIQLAYEERKLASDEVAVVFQAATLYFSQWGESYEVVV